MLIPDAGMILNKIQADLRRIVSNRKATRKATKSPNEVKRQYQIQSLEILKQENIAPDIIDDLSEVGDLKSGTPASKEPVEETRPLSVVRRDDEEGDTPDTFFELDELPVFIVLYKYVVVRLTHQLR